MKLSDYVKEEWSEFGSKVNKRQLPSMCDGFNKAGRKLVWALKEETKFEIAERLGLKAAERTSYQHGGSNIVDNLVGMTKGFSGTNNVPMFDGEGQFGYSADPESSAPRYINCKISENFKNWFNPIDFQLMERVIDRGETLEPVVMAPIAPLILVNGGFGIGSGFATNIAQYLPKDVIKAVKETLEEGFIINPLIPGWVGWGGTIIPDPKSSNKFHPRGEFKRIDSTTVEVYCLPPSYNEKTYMEKVLVPLYESGQIQTFDNESNEIEGWKVVVGFKRGILNKMSDDEVHNLLATINTKKPINLNITCWDVNGHIKKFEWIEELVEEWVVWRLGIYSKRIDYELKIVNENIKFELAKKFLINMFMGSNKAPTKSMVLNGLVEFDNTLTKKQIESLLNITVMSMTAQGLEKSALRKDELLKRKDELLKLTPKNYMLLEVNQLFDLYS